MVGPFPRFRRGVIHDRSCNPGRWRPNRDIDFKRSSYVTQERHTWHGNRRYFRQLDRHQIRTRGIVSRVSVREALRALESMGKIEIRRNAGSFVMNPNGSAFASQLKATHPVDRAFLDYLVDVRAAVEDKVVELVAKRADADLSAVRAVLERTEAELGESVEQGSLDLRFEAALAREVGNPLLAEMQRPVHQLWVEAWSVCRITPGDWRRFHAEHLEIFEALKRSDGG